MWFDDSPATAVAIACGDLLHPTTALALGRISLTRLITVSQLGGIQTNRALGTTRNLRQTNRSSPRGRPKRESSRE